MNTIFEFLALCVGHAISGLLIGSGIASRLSDWLFGPAHR